MKTYISLFIIFFTTFLFSQNKEITDGLFYLNKTKEFEGKNSDSIYFYSKKGLSLIKNKKSDSLKHEVIFNIISYTKDSEERDSLFNDYEKLFLNKDKPEDLQKLYYAVGYNYYINNNHDFASTYFLKIDSLEKESQIFNAITVKSLIFRAAISKQTFTKDGVNLAVNIAESALQKAKKLEDNFLTNRSYLQLAELYLMTNNPKKGIDYLKKAKAYFTNAKQYNYLARVYLLYMNYYYDQNKIDLAEEQLKKGINTLTNTGYDRDLADLYIFYGDFFKKKKKDYVNAFKNYQKAESIYYDNKKELNLHYVYLLEGISESFEALGDYKNALLYNKKAYETRKEIYKKQNRELSRKLEVAYQAKDKEQKLAFLEKQKKTQNNLYLALTSLLALIGLFLFISYKNKQKVTKKLAELDKEKSRLFANISHELRTPLTLIKSPIDQLLQKEKLPKEEKSILTLVKRNADRLLDLVTQLLDVSKIENNQYSLQVSPNNPKQFFNIICDSFSYLAKQKQITFLPYISCDLKEAWFDSDVVEKIITNILQNALKYTPEKGTVICNVYCQDNTLNIEIKNTGKGLTKEEKSKIFERFYQADHLSPGVGLGLALVKNLVNRHKGKITVTSTPNQWTTFVVTIPVAKNSYNKSEIQENKISASKQTEQNKISKTTTIAENSVLEDLDKTKKSKKELPIMLIVEDNDDVRALLKYTFSPCYTIIEATNGKAGIEKAIEHIPDIIISDVMMSEVDGFKLCSTLKNDFKTSHIPIILLTAKAGQENILEGTLCGADDYVVKPFNLDYLQIKIENLITSRKKLQQRYKQDAVLTPKDIAITNLDQDFLKRIEDILKEHLTETSFNTEAFAKAACLSRMQLHRKLKALTGLSTTEFIRSQRLKLAAHLLKQSDANVSEIGYQVGFSSPAYFGKIFKDTYGCSPSEYAKRK